jgi:signal transduction histidine kinase
MQGPKASLLPARALGQEAVILGLETLDMARMHEEALSAITTSSSRSAIIKRAEIFFAEAITPIEKTHRAALKANSRLGQLMKSLSRRTVDLAATNRSLKEGILRRKTVEKALKKSGGQSKKLLEESRRLQKHLQHLTHQILIAQEDKRRTIGHTLQDEIGQTLLGINVRLLSLKQDATANAESLQKEIAGTRHLLDTSMRSIKRFGREYGKHHES